jgi:hypothetical protein
MDIEWAVAEIDGFLKLTNLHRKPDPPGVVSFSPHLSNSGRQEDIVSSAEIVEKIFDRAIPDWRTSVPSERNKKVNRWCQHIEAAQRVRTKLLRQHEIEEKLGENAPRLNLDPPMVNRGRFLGLFGRTVGVSAAGGQG